MNKGKVRHLFPGNNTCVGFYSYYPYIMPQSQANHIFCLKGGPGVGKSTFMKKAGQAMRDKGFDIEFLHCSSDPSSLDGIVLPSLNIALIDGTAPHVIDPINPGAVDEIVNLGEFWNLSSIKRHKQEIIQTNMEVGRLFKRAYKYLAAAKTLHDDIREISGYAIDIHGFSIEAELLIENELSMLPLSAAQGKIKKHFASAITPSGVISYLDTLIDETYKVYTFESAFGIEILLKLVCSAAIVRGLFTELYFCPMGPAEKIEHVIIPELKLAFITENEYHHLKSSSKTPIGIERYKSSKKDMNDAIEFDTENFKMLLREAVATLAKAKEKHDYMESFYVPYMDFDKVHEKVESVINRILENSLK